MRPNTHPNTPFGKFAFKHGFWHPTLEATLEAVYNGLKEDQKLGVTMASGWIGVINANLKTTPDMVFTLLQTKFPAITKENVTDALNKLNINLLKIQTNTPDNFNDALQKLQNYLLQFNGNTWAIITRAVVSCLTDIFLNGTLPVQTIEMLLEYVYRIFVKDKIA